jgi:copper chaperone CopZ
VNKTGTRQFKIRGMDCAEEVAILKREVGPLVGGESRLSFDILKARMTVEAPEVADGAILQAVERTELPIVLATGGLPDYEKGPFAAVLEKPFSADELLRSVRTALDRG